MSGPGRGPTAMRTISADAESGRVSDRALRSPGNFGNPTPRRWSRIGSHAASCEFPSWLPRGLHNTQLRGFHSQGWPDRSITNPKDTRDRLPQRARPRDDDSPTVDPIASDPSSRTFAIPDGKDALLTGWRKWVDHAGRAAAQDHPPDARSIVTASRLCFETPSPNPRACYPASSPIHEVGRHDSLEGEFVGSFKDQRSGASGRRR
jgi:hypothetical protein